MGGVIGLAKRCRGYRLDDGDRVRVAGIQQSIADRARRHQLPTLLDAAADVPPLERLAGYNTMGFDLVAVSGGKAMRGPNDTGLLLGRKELIDAAKANQKYMLDLIGKKLASDPTGRLYTGCGKATISLSSPGCTARSARC